MSPVASADVSESVSGTTVGVTGLRPRWTVSTWGSVHEWGSEVDASPLDWYVAADDRWHVPADEPTIRQRRVEGTPVVETRLRIPDGDAVQRVWAVPERGGMVVVEIENESPLPFAVAFSGPPVSTERPASDMEVQGIELPPGSFVLPVGHHSTVRVLLGSHGREKPSGWPAVPPADAVARGWVNVVERASRLNLPDDALVEAVTAARCDLLLEGPVDPIADPIGFLLDVAELVRCGDDAADWILDIVDPAEQVARTVDRSGMSAASRRESIDALCGARRVASTGGDDRAAGDLGRIIADLETDPGARRRWGRRTHRGAGTGTEGRDAGVEPGASFADIRRSGSVGRFVRSVERLVVAAGPRTTSSADTDSSVATAALLPSGLPTGWLGSNFDVHGLPSGPASTVSFAVRWHGERPAVLWEQDGPPVVLTSPRLGPSWSSSDASGEALWDAPRSPAAARSRLSVTAMNPATSAAGDEAPPARPTADGGQPWTPGLDPDGGSFS